MASEIAAWSDTKPGRHGGYTAKSLDAQLNEIWLRLNLVHQSDMQSLSTHIIIVNKDNLHMIIGPQCPAFKEVWAPA